ncbi:MAG: prolyl oligopeptidase family serine peptidase [Acidobacteriia bacterium]|nr:prolyl oligopeptidase family serine peptidase [Terriglobia bacterium]
MKHAQWLFAISLMAVFAAERPVPAPGIPVPAADRAELESGLNRLNEAITPLIAKHGARSLVVADIRIYHDAVRYALTYNEFLKAEEIPRARKLLEQGLERAHQLAEGRTPWASQTGLLARGYVSKIDDSVQPYGLIIPANWRPDSARQWRLDIWFRGRSETVMEANFLNDRQTKPGEFNPPDTIVLHVYGRFCNANKFAGEVDTFEALEAVKKQYRIDPNRISVRGFSMGGAAVWHLATHYAGLWAAAAPGAGFSETAEFLKVFQNEVVQPTWWEQKLWHLYDATDYAVNFFNLPVVAYSGEIDKQMQAATVMAREMDKEGIRLKHIIGPNTAHRYHPDSKVEIDSIMDNIVQRGRDPYPRKVRFTTFTLAYNRMKWVQVNSLARHWERARIDAEMLGGRRVEVSTQNVTGFSFLFEPGGCLLENTQKVTLLIDGQQVMADPPVSDRSWTAHFRKTGTRWAAVSSLEVAGLHKKHGLQGPIDDAFMDRFVFVQPSGKARSPQVEAWVQAEMSRAITEWRRHYRGEALVKKDTEVTGADIASSNLVLWGDAAGNQVLARLAAKLPVQWGAEGITAGKQQFAAATHVPVMIYPNPLNPARYVVLNSGFTFREYDYLNNARQVPKLPDWAVVDITTPPDSRWPGRVAAAGFFDEQWRMEGEQPPAAKTAARKTSARKRE